jgi:diguanylate cyclase (GGDEF)-like protein
MAGQHPFWRFLIAHAVACARFALLVALLVPGTPLRAATPGDWLPVTGFCYRATELPAPARDHAIPGGFFCGGAPEGYQQGSLWMMGGARMMAGGGRTPVLMVHSTRFDRLLVGFRYADGAVVWQDVRSGNFAGHWRLGGQIGFPAPLRDARLSGVVLRFDRLTSIEMVQIRLVPSERADLQMIALATLIGAALMLLVIGMVYNLALALAVRRMFPVVQAIWSAVVAAWGTVWSQLHLFVLPGMAGTASSQINTILSCALLMLTTFSMASAIEPGHIPRGLRRATLALALTTGLIGLLLGLMRNSAVYPLLTVEGWLSGLLLVMIVACLVLALQRGSAAARAFAAAWLVPLAATGVAGFVDVGYLLWGGGPRMLVLLAAAWQTVWLSIAATRRFNLLRQERDQALAAQKVAHDLARCDPLTGLSNRRGFIERIAPLLDAGPVALLLIDVDRFKLINDTHGHDTGDTALIAIARRLSRWDCATQVVGRLGGEEFAILATGFGRFAANSFAEAVRQGVATCDHAPPLAGTSVTVSVGLVLAEPGDDFATLYRAADGALYEAKRQGRNRVVMAHQAEPVELLQADWA